MFYAKTQLSDESKKIFDDYKEGKSNCCNASVKTITGTNILGEIYECNLCNRSCSLKEENNGIKIDNISKRVRVFKNDFAIEADIFQNGKITIINTQHHYDKHDDHSFKFIGSTPKTIKKIGELLIALSEIK